jgi:hypothetical protein
VTLPLNHGWAPAIRATGSIEGGSTNGDRSATVVRSIFAQPDAETTRTSFGIRRQRLGKHSCSGPGKKHLKGRTAAKDHLRARSQPHHTVAAHAPLLLRACANR